MGQGAVWTGEFSVCDRRCVEFLLSWWWTCSTIVEPGQWGKNHQSSANGFEGSAPIYQLPKVVVVKWGGKGGLDKNRILRWGQMGSVAETQGEVYWSAWRAESVSCDCAKSSFICQNTGSQGKQIFRSTRAKSSKPRPTLPSFVFPQHWNITD